MERHEARLTTSKRALIVDDSRSARLVLSRVLEDHGLDVDTRASAEEALEYLARQRPDVIFMDHLMPGMDGLQAVRVIKNNPNTATIPIMMYTSQEGELYVSQARALGAIGVLPKQVKPVAVSGVLRSLNLLPGEPMPAWTEPAAPATSHAEAERRGVNLTDLRSVIRDTLDERLAMLNREFAAELETRLALYGKGRTWRRLGLAAGLVLVGLAIGVLLGGGEPTEPAPPSRVAGADITAAAVAPAAAEQGTDAIDGQTIEALEWGINLSAGYGYEELPLGDRRLAILQGLLVRLERLGFRGDVELVVHAGEFCLSGTATAGFRPADSELSVAECDAIGPPVAAAGGSPAELQSIGFANYLTTLGAGGTDGIRVNIVPVGGAEPRVGYPELAAGLTAGEWNRAAAANSRVEIALHPDGRLASDR